MSIQLSIIIPVYKVEQYIQECLESVFSQIPDGVEVIVIDDGSPDQSMAIIGREFHEWISSGVLILLQQENKGPGGARNLGIVKSNGKFIGFLDSDDLMIDGYFNEIMPILHAGGIDVCEFGFQRFSEASELKNPIFKPYYPYLGVRKIDSIRIQVFASTSWVPSIRVYNKSLFSGIKFPDKKYYEDVMTIPLVYQQNIRINFIRKTLLGYRIRSGSITSLHTTEQLQHLNAFYWTMPDSADSAFRILKIRTARTILYFSAELGSRQKEINQIVFDIKKIKLSNVEISALIWPDNIFYKYPNAYASINYFRIQKLKLFLALRIAIARFYRKVISKTAK